MALHPYPWEIKLDEKKIFLAAENRDLINVYFAIYNQYLASTGKARWACKSTFMIEHVAEVLQDHPQARFIFMVRDGRDVAVSAKSSIFNNFHVYYCALRWQREQRLGLDWLARLPAAQIMLLKYEDLIGDPRNSVQKLCAFLGEEFQEQMLEYHRSREAKKSGSLCVSWENTSKPVLTTNKEKFRTLLSRKEILLFESIAANELIELGYQPSHPLAELRRVHHDLIQPKQSYHLSEFLLWLRAEARHLCKDSNSIMRLKKLWFMKYLKFTTRWAKKDA